MIMMKKRIIILIVILCTGFMVPAQVAININGAEPDNSAMLDVQSGEKGILIPRMTSLERENINSPAEGLLVYDTDLGQFHYYHSGFWNALIEASWSLNGNAGTDPATQFIGTTDTSRLVFKVNDYRAGLLSLDGVTTFGCSAGFYNSALSNTFIGAQSGYRNTTGNWNTALGYQSFWGNMLGHSNTALGVYSLQNNQQGNYNLAAGHQSLGANQSGCYNTAVGALSSIGIVNGQNNTAVGYLSLGTNQSGNNNTAIGKGADVAYNNLVNTVVIGYNSVATESNEVRLGNFLTQSFYCQGAWEATSSNVPNMVVDNNGQIMRSTAPLVEGTGVDGRVAFWEDTDSLGSNPNLFWDNSNGKLGIGTNVPGQTLTVNGTVGLLETGVSPQYHTTLQGGDQLANITYTLPADAGTSGQMLSTDGTGVLSWQTPSPGDITAVGSMTSGEAFAGPAADNQWLGLGAAAGRIEFTDLPTDVVKILDARVGIGISFPSQQLHITGSFDMPPADGTNGIIYKNGVRFLHDYESSGNLGENVFIGRYSGNFTLGSMVYLEASNNTGIGASSLQSLTTGYNNVAVGNSALKLNDQGYGNIAIGVEALNSNTTGNNNIALGNGALNSSNGNGNLSIGFNSGYYNTTGSENISIGPQAMQENKSGSKNTVTGFQSGQGSMNNSFNNCTLYGYQSGYGLSTGSNNSLIGYKTGRTLSTGSNNILVGYQAGDALTTGSNNIVLGYDVDVPDPAGSYQMVIGAQDLLYGDLENKRLGIGTTEPGQQVELTGSVQLPVTISSVTGVIYKDNDPFLHDYHPDGFDGKNIFMGQNAGNFSMSGTSSNEASGNIGIGYESLSGLTTGFDNTAIGTGASGSNMIGYSNTTVGANTLTDNQNGSSNTAVGANALRVNVWTGSTAIGAYALGTNVAGEQNTALGMNSGFNNLEGSYNVLVGVEAGCGSFQNTYSRNTILGYKSGHTLSSGSNNILLGYQAGDALTSGSNNIIIGYNIDVPVATGNDQLVIGATDLFYGDISNKRIGIGTTSPGQKLTVDGTFGLLETGASPKYHTIFQGGDQTADITYTLPVNDGNSGEMLTTDGSGVLSWTPAGNIDGAGTANQLAFWSDANTLSSNSNLYWDNSHARLGIGTNTPYEQLDLTGNIRLDTTAPGKGIIYCRNDIFIHNAGYNNTFVGEEAGNLTLTGKSNTGMGSDIFHDITSGKYNSAFGTLVLDYLISGDYNTALGSSSQERLETGSYNTSAGSKSLIRNVTGSCNTAFGYAAGQGESGDSFSNNCLFGYKSGINLTTGSNNILTGYQSGDNITTGSNNIIIGYDIDAPSATGNNQVVIGASDLFYGDLANKRIGIGTTSPNEQLELTGNLRLPASTSTTGIIYAGSSPFIHNAGTRNNFMGQVCGNLSLSGAVANSAVGDSALYSISTGDYNVAFGEGTLKSTTTAPGNVAIGRGAGRKIVSNGYNTIVGYQAGVENTADRNTFLGCETGFKNTTGHYNAFIGHQAGYKNTTANNSVAIGYRALYNQAGEATDNDLNNTAIGYEALYTNNPTQSYNGRWNVAVGHKALRSNNTGYGNTSSGYEASHDNTTGYYNTSYGFHALQNNETGDENTAIGTGALMYGSSINKNTAVGYMALGNNTGGSGNTAIGNNANVTTSDLSNTIVIGYNAEVNASDKAVIGNASVTTVGGYGNWSNYSDRRLKENIEYTNGLGLDFIMQLKTVSYNYIDDENKRRRDGLIAQDVQRSLGELGIEFSGLIIDNDAAGTMNLSYSEFVVPLINAVQEQQQTINKLQEQLSQLQNIIEALQK